MEPNKHPIWEVFPDANTIEDFQKKILEPIYFKEEVSDDIKGLASVSEKLLLHSFYEYEFIDVALTQAVFTFEKALKTRWFELHKKRKKHSLEELIDWFYDNNFFETRNDGLPHQLRRIRNGKAHGEEKSLGGVVFIRMVYETFDLINDLYEDPSLRVLRQQESYDLSNQLSGFSKEGAILTWGKKRLIIFELYPVFIDNKTQPNSLRLVACPIFDLSKFEQGNHFDPPHYVLNVIDWKFTNDEFRAKDIISGETVTLSRIEDDVNLKRFEDWCGNFYKLDNWNLIRFITTDPINDLFVSSVRNFHRL